MPYVSRRTVFFGSCSSTEDNDDSDVEEAECEGESFGVGTVELATDEATRLVAGLLLFGNAVVDAILLSRIN